jgi:DNA processing protein
MDEFERLVDAVSLGRADGIGPATARRLIRHYGSATDARKAPVKEHKALGLTDKVIQALRDPAHHTLCKHEVQRALDLGARVVTLGDLDYPRRLAECTDAPVALYVMGNPELNPPRSVAMVGTRQVSAYGKEMCDRIVRELQPYGATVISGLAYGVDIHAHRAALQHGLPTVACLAHGLHRIYPNEHVREAREMVENGGGWITEFAPGVQPVRTNFPERNRIIAGLADATVVVESGEKGGSMITARLAASYHREVFAVPGMVTSKQSGGCNVLIRRLEAVLLTDGAQLARELGWENGKGKPRQLALLHDLSDEERCVVNALSANGIRHVDVMLSDLEQAGFNQASLPVLVFNLEMQGIIRQLPGKRYSLIT